MKFEEPKVTVVELDFAEKITSGPCEHPHEGAKERCIEY